MIKKTFQTKPVFFLLINIFKA